jgi:hypothetical protein
MSEAALRAMEFGLFALMSVINPPQEASKPVEAKPAVVQQIGAPEQQVVPVYLVASSVVATEAQ